MQFLGASKETVVPSRFEEPSSCRARPLTLALLLLATAGIILANVSSEPATADVIRNGERAYGWPFTWYWRSAEKIPGTFVAFVGAGFVRVNGRSWRNKPSR